MWLASEFLHYVYSNYAVAPSPYELTTTLCVPAYLRAHQSLDTWSLYAQMTSDM